MQCLVTGLKWRSPGHAFIWPIPWEQWQNLLQSSIGKWPNGAGHVHSGVGSGVVMGLGISVGLDVGFGVVVTQFGSLQEIGHFSKTKCCHSQVWSEFWQEQSPIAAQNLQSAYKSVHSVSGFGHSPENKRVVKESITAGWSQFYLKKKYNFLLLDRTDFVFYCWSFSKNILQRKYLKQYLGNFFTKTIIVPTASSVIWVHALSCMWTELEFAWTTFHMSFTIWTMTELTTILQWELSIRFWARTSNRWRERCGLWAFIFIITVTNLWVEHQTIRADTGVWVGLL